MLYIFEVDWFWNHLTNRIRTSLDFLLDIFGLINSLINWKRDYLDLLAACSDFLLIWRFFEALLEVIHLARSPLHLRFKNFALINIFDLFFYHQFFQPFRNLSRKLEGFELIDFFHIFVISTIDSIHIYWFLLFGYL